MVLIDKVLAALKAVAQSGTSYSSAMALEASTGHIGLEVISTAGSITITQQCSFDNSTWYDPIDSNGTALGQVIAAQTVTTGIFVVPDVVLAPFIRYKIVEGGTALTAVSIRIVAEMG